MKKVKRLRIKRYFSEEFKKARIAEYESGEFTVLELSKLYSKREPVIYRWIYKFSILNKKSVVVVESKDSGSKKLKDYEKRIKELERIVGQKQIQLDYLEKLLEIAETDLGFDLKKSTQSKPCAGSTKTRKS